jgi:hypothetical protein
MTANGKAAAAAGVWLLALGYVGLYVYCAAIGFFSPGEMVGFGIVAAVLAVLFVVRSVRVMHTIRHPDAPHHDETMRALHRQRELRGF